MSAIRSSQVIPLDHQPPARVKRRRRRARTVSPVYPHRALMWEVGGKLGICLVLLAMVTAGLVRLVPRAIAQHQQLQAIEQDRAHLDQRVQQLQADFGYRFDPQQAQRIMQEQSNRVAPGQVQVIWLDPQQQQADAMPPGAPKPPVEYP